MSRPPLFTVLLLLLGSGVARADEAGIAFFEKEVRPVLVEHCYACHSAEGKKTKGGLRLDTRDGLLTGGDSGPALVPGDPDKSILVTALRYLDKDLQMPPAKDGSKKLPAETIAKLEQWVKKGAPDPRTEAGPAVAAASAIDYAAARKMWAYRRPEMPAIPEVKNAAWAHSPVDRFILAKLEERGLQPAAPAEKATLLRRATFDLTGLPPKLEELDAFLADTSPDAFAKVVDRLLASPAYGERWARHWLDVARYTDSFDSRGTGGAMDCVDAWRYRDWVVNAFNRDLPYADFVKQQVAGDLLAAQNFDPEKVVATSVYAIGNWGGGDADKEKLLTDIADDQVDLTSRAFLGLTLACARCHDHKFDPLSTQDYYGLAGIFFSSHILPNPGPKTNGPDMLRVSLESPAQQTARAEAKRRVAEIDAELAGGLQPLTEVKRDVLGKPGLVSWAPKGADNPSLVINNTDAEISFLSIKLPGRAIAVHPGPKMPVTAAWRSPLSGTVRVSGRVRDVDPTCGDGVAWEIPRVASGVVENGKTADISEKEIAVEAGQLVSLIIRPRGEYTCDSTQIDLVVKAADGRVWDLREALLAGAAQGHENTWWICAGAGSTLTTDRPDQANLTAERERLAAELARPEPMTHGLQEGGCPTSPHAGLHDVKVHVRGRYDRLGELVPRRFPMLLAGDVQPAIASGSGRLALAEWLTSAENPQTARVMVNRIWQHHFGEGIVRTPNNFGKLGAPPTHPELLDFLALEFVKSGWSMKAMHRLMMLSAAYQQSCAAPAATLQADADNLLFSRMNRRRLESEALRDSLLVAAGKLDATLGGPSIPELQSNRRTLYVRTVRSDRATYQSLFDAADPTSIVEKRNDSTVAPQALFLLNHSFASTQSRALAERVQQQPAEARTDWLYRTLFARTPTAAEKQIGEKAIAVWGANAAAWEQYCHALICANEFVYVD